MCLIGIRLSEDGEIFIAANRDEFAERPTLPMHWWDGHILAGKDLKAGGTWLGITKTGRFAAITNVRDLSIKDHAVPMGSRGLIVSAFLRGTTPAEAFVSDLAKNLNAASPFNLLVGELHETPRLWWLGGRVRRIEPLQPGHHTLSNAELNTPWPKSQRLHAALQSADALQIQAVMTDQTPAEEDALPETGVPLDWEKRLSPILITGDDYHTRSTSLIRIRDSQISAKELTWTPQGRLAKQVDFAFALNPIRPAYDRPGLPYV